MSTRPTLEQRQPLLTVQPVDPLVIDPPVLAT
jgi:hypothetical protein